MELPAFLQERLRAQYGAEEEKIVMGMRARRVTSFRANTLKMGAEQVKSALFSAHISFGQPEWYSDAFFVQADEYQNILRLPLYGRGEIYLQSLSSMLPPLFLQPQAGERILDMTAAPGGKTLEMCALSEGRALITACERDKVRFERLNYNVKMQGAKNVVTMCCDAASLSEFMRFDKILLDAPCSGSGTITEGSAPKMSEKQLFGCLKAQEALLKKALSLLKKGGVLLYSTCSLLKEENEEQIFRALRGTDCRLEPIGGYNVPTLPCAEGMLTVCPDAQYEGFFIAKIAR